MFAHGEHELSKREVVASPQKDVTTQDSETTSQLTKETPAKTENSVSKGVFSPSLNSESNLVFCEDLLVTEAECDVKELLNFPQKLIYEQLGFGNDYSVNHKRLRVFQSITKERNVFLPTDSALEG